MTSELLSVDIVWQQNGRSARAKFSMADGITALIGPSGAGKTTLARLITGLERPLGGSILFKGKSLYRGTKKRFTNARQRNIGLVMQDANLFPHLTVEQNIRFSPRSTPESCSEAIGALGVKSLLHRNTGTLSGGEKRKVAIARALAARPQLIILDEPMTGLDPKAREEVLLLIKTINRTAGTPVLFITHHLEDMLAVADNAVLMAPGKTVATGTLEQVILAQECASLLGLADAGQLLTARITGKSNNLLEADASGSIILLPDSGETVGSDVTLRIFASDISLARQKSIDISILNQIAATIMAIREEDKNVFVDMQLEDSDNVLTSKITRHSLSRLELKLNDKVYALIKAVSVKDVIPAPTSNH